MPPCQICNAKEGTEYKFTHQIVNEAVPPGLYSHQTYKVKRFIKLHLSFCPECLQNLHRKKRKSFWGKMTWNFPEKASLDQIASAYYQKNRNKILNDRFKNRNCEICGTKAAKQVKIDYYRDGFEKAIVGYRCLAHPFHKKEKEATNFSLQDSMEQLKSNMESGKGYFHESDLPSIPDCLVNKQKE